MYATFLEIHSWLRWFTLLTCVGGIFYAMRPPREGSDALPGKRWDTYLMLAVDLQMLTGLILYFGLSPYTMDAMNNPSAALRVPSLRFWAITHAGAMFAALLTCTRRTSPGDERGVSGHCSATAPDLVRDLADRDPCGHPVAWHRTQPPAVSLVGRS